MGLNRIIDLFIIAGRKLGYHGVPTIKEARIEGKQLKEQSRIIDDYVKWANEIRLAYLRVHEPELIELLKHPNLQSVEAIKNNELLETSKKLGCAPTALNDLQSIWKRFDSSTDRDKAAVIIIPRLNLCQNEVSEEFLLQFAQRAAESLQLIRGSQPSGLSSIGQALPLLASQTLPALPGSIKRTSNFTVGTMGYHKNMHLSPAISNASEVARFLSRHGFKISDYGDSRHRFISSLEESYCCPGRSAIIFAMQQKEKDPDITFKVGVVDINYR